MITVLGSTGQLGVAVRRRVGDGWFPTREEVDLARLDAEAVRSELLRRSCSALINCAAYTAVDRAESEEGEATAINGESVGRLATICAEIGIPFVTYSTDYVFDGSASSPYVESSLPNPVNAYGRSKLEGERHSVGVGKALVIRTSWVISATHPNFVGTMLDLAIQGRQLRVVNDQRGRPTSADDLAEATMRAISAGATGLLHLSNTGPVTTWFELARVAFELGSLEADLIPCSSHEYPTAAVRPMFSVLGSNVTGRHSLSAMPNWRASLALIVRSQLALRLRRA